MVVSSEGTDPAVLIPAGVSSKSLTCVRSLGSRGVKTIVASSERSVPASASKYCDLHVTVPSPYVDLLAYKETLLSLAGREDVRTIVPSREVDAYVLSRYRDEFAERVEPLWPDLETLRRVQDGLAIPDVAAAADVPVPDTMSFDDVDDWSRELIIKPRYAILIGEYVEHLSERECDGRLSPIHPEPDVVPDREEVLSEMFGHVPLVQSYAPIEDEYSVRALYDDGDVVATSLRRQVRGKSYAGGASVYRELVDIPELTDLGLRVLDELDWHGLATVQFIERADTGEYEFIEVNPRTWTSIPTDVRAGADYPHFFWQVATGDQDLVDPGHELGPGTHLLFGEIQYLASVLTEEYPNADRPSFPEALREVGRSMVESPAFDYLVRDDPVPFVDGAMAQAKRRLRR